MSSLEKSIFKAKRVKPSMIKATRQMDMILKTWLHQGIRCVYCPLIANMKSTKGHNHKKKNEWKSVYSSRALWWIPANIRLCRYCALRIAKIKDKHMAAVSERKSATVTTRFTRGLVLWFVLIFKFDNIPIHTLTHVRLI